MFRTALIGLAAAAALTAGATAASAKVHWDVDVNVGLPGAFGGYYGGYYPVYDPYPPHCFYVKKHKWVNMGGFWVKKSFKSLVCE